MVDAIKVYDLSKIRETLTSMEYTKPKTNTINFDEYVTKESPKEWWKNRETTLTICVEDRSKDRAVLMRSLADILDRNKNEYAKIAKSARGILLGPQIVSHLSSSLRYHSIFTNIVCKEYVPKCIIQLPETCCLSVLAYSMVKAILQGSLVFIITSPYMGPELEWLKGQMLTCGFPKELFNIYYSYDPLPHDLCSHEYRYNFDQRIKSSNGIEFNVFPLSIPFIIFENSDIDSACDSLINATWRQSLMFPWTHKQAMIQESIYDIVVDKLKKKIAHLSNEQVFPDNKFGKAMQSKIDRCVQRAKELKINIYSKQDGQKILLDALPFSDLTEDPDLDIAPVISVMAFRNVNEAIAIANNCKQGLAASVWTENIGLANQVAEKLEVANVWTNNFGIYSFEVGFTPRKKSSLNGRGFTVGNFQNYFLGENLIRSKERGNEWASIKKAQLSWKDQTRQCRINRLISSVNSILEYATIDNNLRKLTEKFNKYLIEYILNSPYHNYQSNVEEIAFKQLSEPRGVLEIGKMDEMLQAKFVISALIEGNVIVLLTNNVFYKILSKKLSDQILIIKMMEENPADELNLLWPFIFYEVTYLKNIWFQ